MYSNALYKEDFQKILFEEIYSHSVQYYALKSLPY